MHRRTAAFRSPRRMGTDEWQQALAAALEEAGAVLPLRRDGLAPLSPAADRRAPRRRGFDVLHLRPEGVERHRLSDDAEVRGRTALPLWAARWLARQPREVERPADPLRDASVDLALERRHLLGRR